MKMVGIVIAAALVSICVTAILVYRYGTQSYLLHNKTVTLTKPQFKAFKTISGEITKVSKEKDILQITTKNAFGPGYIMYYVCSDGKIIKPYGDNVAKSFCGTKEYRLAVS